MRVDTPARTAGTELPCTLPPVVSMFEALIPDLKDRVLVMLLLLLPFVS